MYKILIFTWDTSWNRVKKKHVDFTSHIAYANMISVFRYRWTIRNRRNSFLLCFFFLLPSIELSNNRNYSSTPIGWTFIASSLFIDFQGEKNKRAIKMFIFMSLFGFHFFFCLSDMRVGKRNLKWHINHSWRIEMLLHPLYCYSGDW